MTKTEFTGRQGKSSCVIQQQNTSLLMFPLNNVVFISELFHSAPMTLIRPFDCQLCFP